MGFTKSIESCFNHYFTFTGRAPRSEYNYWTLFNILISWTLEVILLFNSEGLVFFYLITLVLMPPSISVIIRRFHDTGRSGWNWFWFLTIIGIPVVIYWLVFQEGENGDNKYGSNPLSVNNTSYRQSNSPIQTGSSNISESNFHSDTQNKPKAEKKTGSYEKGGLYD